MSLSRLPSQRMWAGRGYGFSMVSSWSAWASGVSVGLPHIESTGSFNARHGAGQVAGRCGGSTPAHSAVAASAGACRPLANGLANGRNCCHLVGLPAYALEGRLGPGTRNRPGPFTGLSWQPALPSWLHAQPDRRGSLSTLRSRATARQRRGTRPIWGCGCR